MPTKVGHCVKLFACTAVTYGRSVTSTIRLLFTFLLATDTIQQCLFHQLRFFSHVDQWYHQHMASPKNVNGISTDAKTHELEVDGIRYQVVPAKPNDDKDQTDCWLRQYIMGDVVGPVVGRCRTGQDGVEPMSIDLDPIGYGGEYVVEMLEAKTVEKKHPSALLCPLTVPTEVTRRFQEHGLVVWNEAVPTAIMQQLRTEILRNHKELMTSENHGQEEEIRSDNIRFISQRDAEEDATEILKGLDLLEHAAASVANQPIFRPDQGMCALYAGDKKAHYTWHYDNERDESGHWRNYRTLTAILYLNPTDWDGQRDGGQLECEGLDKPIVPYGGTIVLFDSCRIRHRVLPAYRDRVALTQWFVKLDWDSPPKGLQLQRKRPSKAIIQKEAKRPKEDISATKASFDDAFQGAKCIKETLTSGSSQSDGFSFGFFG